MAEPSRANWDEGQPRVCSGCGGKLRITKDDLWLNTAERESWHMACYLERAQAHRDWKRLRQGNRVEEAMKRKEQEEWDRKRDLEQTLRKTGEDPILLTWPP